MSGVSIPLKTFKLRWALKNALALIGNVTPEMQDAIEKELKEGIAAEEEALAIMRDPEALLRQSGGDDEDDEGAPPSPNGVMNGGRRAKPVARA